MSIGNDRIITEVRPLLRWAGSKRKLLPKLISFAPDKYCRYIEPFVGSGCLYLALNPKKAILSDLNKQLIDTYKTIRKNPSIVARKVHAMPDNSDFYYVLRGLLPEDLDDFDRAARFIYLNRYCFNGVYRTNKMGQFNVPRGTNGGRIPNEGDFIAFAKALSGTKLIATDFETSLNEASNGDFVYLDPPYSHPNIRYRGEYGYGSFSANDIDRLIFSIRNASARGAIILLSYNCTIKSQLTDWYSRRIYVRRSVAGFNHQRARVVEMVFSNLPLP